jgi:hypothetical protein
MKDVLTGGKLRVVMPLAQMMLAALLLRLSFLHDAATQYDDSRALHPAFILLLCLNFPVSIPLKLLLYGRLSALWFDVIFVSIVGALWYGIATCISIYRKRGAVFPPDRLWLRVPADLLLLAMGVFLVWAVAAELRDYPFMLSPSHLGGWFWFAPICVSSLLWSVGSVLVFGYDFANCVRRR